MDDGVYKGAAAAAAEKCERRSSAVYTGCSCEVFYNGEAHLEDSAEFYVFIEFIAEIRGFYSRAKFIDGTLHLYDV